MVAAVYSELTKTTWVVPKVQSPLAPSTPLYLIRRCDDVMQTNGHKPFLLECVLLICSDVTLSCWHASVEAFRPFYKSS